RVDTLGRIVAIRRAVRVSILESIDLRVWRRRGVARATNPAAVADPAAATAAGAGPSAAATGSPPTALAAGTPAAPTSSAVDPDRSTAGAASPATVATVRIHVLQPGGPWSATAAVHRTSGWLRDVDRRREKGRPGRGSVPQAGP